MKSGIGSFTVFALLAVQSAASARDYSHDGGDRSSHAMNQWHDSHYAPQISNYVPRYSDYSSGYRYDGDRAYHSGFEVRRYRGGFGGGYGRDIYSRGHGAHHGRSARHFDIGPFHFGLGH